MTPLLEGLTHAAAIIFYAAAFTMGIIAHWHSRMWSRKVSSLGVMLITGGWIAFYLFVSDLNFTAASTPVVWSRVFHYNTATWLFVMAFVIYRSEKYGVRVALTRGTFVGEHE